jgi:aryl-alcohol dehydrogenase-like predicted oxidoreductase
MAAFPNSVRLGRSELLVSPLGMAGGYGAPRRALLKAFDHGVNYWYHGSRRLDGMREAIRDIVAAGQRDRLVLLLQSYARWPWLMERTFTRGLKSLKLDHADVLLLGWYNRPPTAGIMERAERMREKGLVRQLAISGHHRPSFVSFAADQRIGILHIRYNAAHTGAERDVFPHLPREDRPGIVAYTATRWKTLLSGRRMPPGEQPLSASDCYRFVLSNPDFNVCMTGPSSEQHVDEALSALEAGPLTREENERLRRIGRHVHDNERFAFRK